MEMRLDENQKKSMMILEALAEQLGVREEIDDDFGSVGGTTRSIGLLIIFGGTTWGIGLLIIAV